MMVRQSFSHCMPYRLDICVNLNAKICVGPDPKLFVGPGVIAGRPALLYCKEDIYF